MLEVALDKPEYRAGDTMTVAVTARSAGRVTLNVIGDKLLASQTADVKEGVAQIKLPVGRDWGSGAISSPPCGGRSMHRRNACQAVPSACNGSPSIGGENADRHLSAPALLRPNSSLHIPVKVEAWRLAKMRGSSSPRSTWAFSI